MYVKTEDELFAAFKDLANGRADAQATRELLKRAIGASQSVLESLLREILNDARALIDKEADPIEIVLDLAKIAGYSKDLDDFAMAIALLPRIHISCTRARAKKAIAVAFAKAGKFREARDFAKRIRNPFWRAEAHVGITDITRDVVDLKSAINDLPNIYEVRDEVEAQIRVLGNEMGINVKPLIKALERRMETQKTHAR